jgi:hypothetical protein
VLDVGASIDSSFHIFRAASTPTSPRATTCAVGDAGDLFASGLHRDIRRLPKTFDDCRIHHLTPWWLRGRTDLSDLAPLCEVHHHVVHEGGWGLTVNDDRVASWIRPDGHSYWSGTLNDRHLVSA